MKMYALVTDQGTAAAETALCGKCFKKYQNYAREMGAQDVQHAGPFHDCTNNPMLRCVICDEEVIQ